MRPAKLITSLTTAVAATVGLAFAGDEMTSLSYISYLERYATVQPAAGQQAVDAVVNMPVITGDRIDTARGARLEIQLADGSTLWVDEFTTLDFDALAASRENPAQRTVLFLQDGTAALEIPATALGEDPLRFDYPEGSLFLSKPGLYRFDLRSGKLHVQAHAGLAELPAGIGSALLRTGQETWLDGQAGVATAAIADQTDDFWAWVQERRSPSPAARTSEVVGTTTSGRTAALDSYGTWVYVDARSSWAWRPYVQVGWTPYSHGRWYWTPVGWNWVSYEPWGWYPYHYGSWSWDVSAGWLWCWDMVWGPAWVHWIYTPGYIGWCPRGYYDYWYHDNGRHNGGGYPGGGHSGGPGRLGPGRWSEVAYDFSGHVRLRDVDPRPWNMVPANQFTNARLDRVRVAPGRVLAEAGEESRAFVRSGPLLTAPSRGEVERDFDAGFRRRPGTAGGDDLGGILRRDNQPAREFPAGSAIRAVRTADLVASGPRGSATTGRDGQDARNPNDRITLPGGRPMVDFSAGPRSPRPAAGAPAAGTSAPAAAGGSRNGREAGSSGATTPPRSEGTAPARSAPAREPSPSSPQAAPPASGSSSTAPRSREVKPAPAAPAPRKPGYASRIRSYDERVATDTGRTSSRSESPATVTSRTYVVPFEGGRRVVHVTAPTSSSSAGAQAGRGGTTPPTPSRGAYVPRASAHVSNAGSAATSQPRTYSPPPSASRSATPGRSYQAAPSGGTAPRAVSAPAASSSPRSAPASSSGSSRASGGSSASGSRPSGRR